MTISPWAKVQQNADMAAAPPSFDPNVWATPDTTPQPAPSVFASVQPAVKMAPQPPSPEQDQIANDTQRLQKIRWEQANPWGSPENHPGNLGKVAHVFSTLGNIAGDIFAPNVMARIPGTALNRELQEQQLSGRLNSELSDESTNEQRNALTKRTEQDTALEPGKTASEEAYQGAETDKLNNPAPQYIQTDQGYFQVDPHTHVLTPLTWQGSQLQPFQKDQAQKGLEKVDLVGPGGKPIAANYNPTTGKYTDATGKEIANPQPYEKPNQAGSVTMVVPGPDGSQKVERLSPGQTVTPGSMSLTQYGQGSAADVKQGKAETAQIQNLDNELNLMKQFAANPSPTNDAAMLMHYIGATKPESMGKIRLNDRELKLFGGTRSSLGDAEALLTKVANGQSLTPQQRTDMVNTMTMIDAAAKRGHGGESQEPIVQHSPSTGQYRYSTDGGKTWQAGQPNQQK